MRFIILINHIFNNLSYRLVMRNKVKWVWVLALIGGNFLWAGVTDMLFQQFRGVQETRTFLNHFGYSLGMTGPPLVITAIIAFIVVIIIKKRHLFMIFWTVLSLIGMVISTIGALKIMAVS